MYNCKGLLTYGRGRGKEEEEPLPVDVEEECIVSSKEEGDRGKTGEIYERKDEMALVGSTSFVSFCLGGMVSDSINQILAFV